MARPMTLEQLQVALRNAARPAGEGDGFLLKEIVKATRLNADAVADMIHEGLANGTVVRSQRAKMRVDGRPQSVTTFVFLEPAKKGKR